ncbi:MULTISPECIES: hypothetical protein [Metabacillus]|uniref:Uncharacterized protein n=1 Tax=Metabacillus elymi TaxID=2745198 RepID=A0ABX6SB28_9BACI|nr:MULTISPECIES: hypothetical protein [Metabacillus]QNF30091.1 hypothetical protein HUW50_23055 [Metabacillus sp. KUDC1714]
MNYVFLKWDTDDDFVDSEQHVTYDIELYGPNPLTTILILGAVKAAAEMALYLG